MNYLQRKKLAFMSIINKMKGFIRSISSVPPLALEDCVDEDSLIDYKIYGDSVQNGTPIPETPVEVQSVGEKTVNLFDKDNANVFGGYISGNSLIAYSTALGNNRATCIECKPNTTYTISRQVLSKRFVVASGIYAPAKDITFTKSISNYDTLNIQITTGSEDAYLYVWFYNGSVDTEFTYDEIIDGLQIQEGTTATPYEPYGYKIPVTARGKNLFDGSATEPAGSYLVGSGTIATGGSANLRITDYIQIPKNTTYLTFSYEGTSMQSPGMCLYDEDKNYITGVNFSGKYVITISVPSNAKYVRHSYRTINTNIQLETGTTATAYEPYHKPITTNLFLDEPLRKVGDYADYVDFGKGEVVRKVKEVELTGTNSYDLANLNGGCFHIHITDMFVGRREYGFCTHLQNIPKNEQSPIWFSAGNQRIYMFFSDIYNSAETDDEREAAFKAYLTAQAEAGTPVKVTYILAEETHTPITIPKLPTIKGTCIIEADTNIKPSSMEATYYSTSKGG